MARYRHVSRPPQRPPLLAVVLNYLSYIVLFTVCGAMLFLAWPLVRAQLSGQPSTQPAQPTAQIGNVGGQAPPSVRNTYQEPAAPNAVATPIPGVAQNEQESLRIYQATAQASLAAPAVPTLAPAPLPLNSAGQPIIDAQQQQQLDVSAQMAADEQQAAQRAAQLADDQSRAPDVSKQDAEAELHRDLCHVPHADPHTCNQGLFKPTPIGAP